MKSAQIVNEIQQEFQKGDNESTKAPWWAILDPAQNMSCDVHELAGQITGIFFSRKDAEAYLKAHSYNFTKRACVYALSGCYSEKYVKFYEAGVKE